MTDKQFQKIINDVITLKVKHNKLLELAEKEYEERTGHTSIKDDPWIDSLHYGQGYIKVNEIGK